MNSATYPDDSLNNISSTEPVNGTISWTDLGEIESAKNEIKIYKAVTSLQVLIVCINIGMLASLIAYENQHGQKRCVQALARRTMVLVGRRNEFNSGHTLRCLCIIGALFCLLSSIDNLLYYTVGYKTNAGCTVTQILGISFYIELDSVVYIFLWIRQNVTCRKFLIRSRIVYIFLTILKWGVLALIIMLAVVMHGLVILYRRHYYNRSTKTCEKIPNKVDDAITLLWTAGSVTMQILLLFLFACPLLMRISRNRADRKGQNRTSMEASSSQFDANKTQISSIVRRCTIIAVLCVVTDVAAVLVCQLVFGSAEYKQVRALLYNVNISFNLAIIITSFKDWKIMMSFRIIEMRDKVALLSQNTMA